MMMRKLALLFSTVVLSMTQVGQAGVLCGDKAPAFVLNSVSGGTVDLQTFKGRYVVLEWFNHNCPYVNKYYESGAMQKWQAVATSKGLAWFVIDSTNPSSPDFLPPKNARILFSSKKMAATAFLLDEDGVAGKLYNVTTTPEVFLINPEGVVIYRGAIDDTKSRDAEDSAAAHNYLLAAIDEALAGKPVAEPTVAPYGCEVKYLPGKTKPKSSGDSDKPKSSAKSPTKPYLRGKRVKHAS
jgi:hypothetical protein